MHDAANRAFFCSRNRSLVARSYKNRKKIRAEERRQELARGHEVGARRPVSYYKMLLTILVYFSLRSAGARSCLLRDRSQEKLSRSNETGDRQELGDARQEIGARG